MLLFEKDPNFIIDRINTIFPIFYSEQSYDYIKNEINYIWTSMLEKDCSYNFVKAFHSFNITEAICYAKSLVDSAKESKIDVNTIHFDENSNYVDNKILNLLGSFSDSEEIKSTIQLMLRYIKKDEKSILDGFNEIKIRFSVNEQSLKDDFKRENILLETLLEEKNSSEILTILFLQVSKLFLNLVFQPTKEERKFSITIVTINLPCTTGSKKYRELIWNELKKLLSKNLYVNYIINILETYTSNWPDEYNKDILEFDKPHILELINMLPNAQWPFIVKIKRELNKKWEKYNISRTNISRRRIGEENIEIYDLFTSTNNYDEAYEKKIIKYKKEHPDINCDKIIQILDEIINNYPTLFDRIYYNFFTFINYLDKDELIEIILSCLKRKSKLLIPISRFVERLFIITSKKEAYDFICNTNLPNKNLWKFYYFAIPENNKQTKKDYEEFLNILEEGYQEDNYFKNLSFSLTYVKYDSNAIVNIFTKILNFNLPENNLAQIYLNLFFENDINPKQLAKYFKSNKELLFKIYLMGTKHIDIFDYNGNYLYYLLENEEDFIPRYAEEMINKISKYEDLRHDISRIWDCKNYTNIMKTIMEIARKKELYNSGNLKVLFTSGDNKATSWLLSEIKEHNDNDNYMILLFNIISELSESQRLDCIKQFIENNNDVDLFKKLSLAPSSMSTSSSFIPIYQSIVIYLQKVKDIIPDGINYIEHKKHIESLINEWKKRIESQKKREYINEIYFN